MPLLASTNFLTSPSISSSISLIAGGSSGAEGFWASAGEPPATAVPGRFGALALGALACPILPLSRDSKLVEVEAISSKREVAASSLRMIAVSGLFPLLLGVEGPEPALWWRFFAIVVLTSQGYEGNGRSIGRGCWLGRSYLLIKVVRLFMPWPWLGPAMWSDIFGLCGHETLRRVCT